MDNLKILGTENIRKLLFKFAVPAMAGMLLNALYNIVDRIYIGRGVGSMAISGLAVTLPIMTTMIAFALFAGLGGATLISLKLGEQKREEAEKILGNTFVLLVIFGIFVMVVGLIFMKPILFAFGASEQTYPYAAEYLRIIYIGVVFQIVGLGMNNCIRATGSPKTSMITQLIGAVLNIILDPIFIFGFNMGIAGAAWATIIAQFISFLWVMRHFFGKRANIDLNFKNMPLKPFYVKMIIVLGMNAFLTQILQSAVSAITNRQLYAFGGDLAVGAMAAISSVIMILLMLIFGLLQGMQPIVGYNYGARLYTRAKSAFYTAAIVATIICTIGWIITRIFPTQIIKVFNTDPNFISITSFGLFAMMITFPVVGSQICASTFFQAIGKAKKSIFLSLLRQVIILIPLILILPNKMGVKGVWYSLPITDVISFIICAIFVYYEIRSLRGKPEGLPQKANGASFEEQQATT